MTTLKVVGSLSTALAAGAFLLLQTAGARPEITGAVLLSATVLALQLYLIRRVQTIPAEEATRRHDVVNRLTILVTASQQHTDEELQRMEARLAASVRDASASAASERHRLEDRILELERWRPRATRKGEDG